MKYMANFNRKESILILPHNTLRLVDMMQYLELLAANKKPAGPLDFEDNLYKCMARKNKDFSIGLTMPPGMKEKFENNWKYYWDIAPRTNMYDYLKVLAAQKFTLNTTVLFSDPNASDDVFDYDYYDGSIDALEDYIVNKNITAVVLDDIDIIHQITERGRIDINNLSFIISKLGYNYVYDEKLQMLRLKDSIYFDERKSFIEIAEIVLFNFNKEFFDKLKNKRGGNTNE